MTTYTLRLVKATDRRSPSATLSLNTTSGYGIYLPEGSFAPYAGDADVLQMPVNRAATDGQRHINEVRKNAEFTLPLSIRARNQAEAASYRNQIAGYLHAAAAYEQKNVGAPVYLEHRFGDGLESKSPPTFGSFSRYWYIKRGEARWPDDLHGVRLKNGYIVNASIELTCAPLAYGLQEPVGNADFFASLTLLGTILKYPAAAYISGSSFTVSLWMSYPADDDFFPFELYVSGANYIGPWYDFSETKWNLRVNGSDTTASGTNSYTVGDLIHVAVVGSSSNVKLYINNTLVLTRGSAFSATGNYTLYLGSKISGTTTKYTSTIDNVQIWQSEFSSDDVAALYNAGYYIKAAGYDIHRPPFLYSRDGAGGFETVDGTIGAGTGKNWGCMYWLSGDASPLWYADVTPTAYVAADYGLILGHQTYDTANTDFSTVAHYHDEDGTTDTGSSSNNAYGTSNTSTDQHIFKTLTNATYIQRLTGRYTMYARFRLVTSSATCVLTPFMQFDNSTSSASRIYFGNGVTVATSTTMELVRVGDIVFPEWWDGVRSAKMIWGLRVEKGGATLSLQYDFMLLVKNAIELPINTTSSVTLGTTNSIILRNGNADVQDSSDQIDYHLNWIGGDLAMVPGQYNYIWCLTGQAGATCYANQAVDSSQWYITPRYTTSGPLG